MKGLEGRKFDPIPRDKKIEDYTPEERTRLELARAVIRYQGSIKTLREMHGYLKSFDRDEEYLYGEDSFMLEWIKEDSETAFKEAFYNTKRCRTEVDRFKKELIDSFSKGK